MWAMLEPAVSRKTVAPIGGAFLVFVVGFFLFYGREAVSSGSWKYIITHDDEYIYWMIARGAADTPRSDANPFYYEERGRTNPIPAYPTVSAAGYLAKMAGVPVLALLPPWKIFMPFFLWLTMFICLVKLWDYPPLPSAAVSMAVLLVTLFLHGGAQFTLFRFPRPMDGLWLTVIWLSLVANPRKLERRNGAAVVAVGIGALVVSPYFAILGMWVLICQSLWELLVLRDRTTGFGHLKSFAVLLCLCLGYLLLIFSRLDESKWVRLVLSVGDRESRYVDLTSLCLFGVVCLGVFLARRISGKGTSRLDRLTLAVFAVEPLAANAQLLLGRDYQMSIHRYYFFVIEMACLVGWTVEKLPTLVDRPSFRRFDLWIAGLLVAGEAAFLARPELNYFRYLPRTLASHFVFDNSLLLLGLLPVVCLSAWSAFRFLPVGRLVRKLPVAVSLFAAMALLGFSLRPSQLRQYNQDLPFDGAYAWLNENAQKHEVVLTAPPVRCVVDYAPLYTDLKCYANPAGQRLSEDRKATEYRWFFYVSLMQGLLGTSSEGKEDLRKKIEVFRLDYILVSSPDPYEERIREQLEPFLREVYRDDRCLLWRVEVG